MLCITHLKINTSISSSTIDEHGLHMADTTQTQIKKEQWSIIQILSLSLLDHTKFSNHHNFVKLCSLDCFDYVVTDRPVEDRHILYVLKENHVNIIYRKFFADCKIKLNTLEK